MTPPKARSLKVRPVESCDLAFNVSGVIGRQNPLWKVGDRVAALDLEPLYIQLENADADGRLVYNADAIEDFLRQANDGWLFSLRSQSLAAALERMIVQRQIAWLQTYKYSHQIANRYSLLFPSVATPESKLERLRQLMIRTNERYQDLQSAYVTASRTNVATQSNSTQVATLDGDGQSTSSDTSQSESTNLSESMNLGSSLGSDVSNSSESGSSESIQCIRPIGTHSVGGSGESTYTDNPWICVTNQRTGNLEWVDAKSDLPDYVAQKTNDTTLATSNGTTTSSIDSSSRSTSSGTSSTNTNSSSTVTSQSQSRSSGNTITNLSEFIHPYADNDIQVQRRLLDLQDEQIANELLAFRVPNLETILRNECRLVDLEIKQQQINYLNSFLVPPFTGVITGVYKDVGEYVEAGQPVLRIEKDEEIFIVGRVNYRGRLELGMIVDLIAANAFETGMPVTLSGQVVAVRGHDADNDEWDVMFRCDNRDGAGGTGRKLPLNYSFDYRDVTLTLTPVP